MSLNRRQVLRGFAAAPAVAALAQPAGAQEGPRRHQRSHPPVDRLLVLQHRRAIAGTLERTCQMARELGVPSVEIVAPEHWPVLRQHRSDLRHRSQRHARRPVHARLQQPALPRGGHRPHAARSIDACAEARFPSVIAFTGYKWRDPDNPRAARSAATKGPTTASAACAQLAEHAEKPQCHGLRRAPQHARQLASHEGPSRLLRATISTGSPASSAASIRRASSCCSTSITCRSCTAT